MTMLCDAERALGHRCWRKALHLPAGLTQTALAENAGLQVNTIKRLEAICAVCPALPSLPRPRTGRPFISRHPPLGWVFRPTPLREGRHALE
jgi:hypothetical protein